MSEPTDHTAASRVATYNPWAIVTTVIHELASEGVKRSFSYGDALPGGDVLAGAEMLLRGLGVEPVVPPSVCGSCEDGEHRCEGCPCDCDRAQLIRGEL